ncbi:MAG: MFS transporter [Acidimicrobiia bacterium]|nr:MFS transporter [Acidimicrobiia bacterium]
MTSAQERPSTAAAADGGETLRDEAYARRLLPTVLLAVIAFSTSMTIVSAALPTIAEDLGSTTGTLSWSVTGLFLAMAIGTPVMGKLGDTYGHRRVLLVGATVLTLGTAACGLAWDAASFIGARMVVGAGIAATMPTSNALIMQAFPPERRSVAMGWYQMAMTGAPVVGLVIGGPMIEAWGWRTVFAALTPLALTGLVLSFIVIRPSVRGPRVPIDWLGAGALGAATLTFLLGLERMKVGGPADPIGALLFLATVLCLVLFVRTERRSERPLLRLDYFGRRNFTGPLLANSLAQFAYMGGFLISPLLLEEVFGLGVAAVALVLLFRPGTFSLTSPVGGRLAARLGDRPVVVAASVSMVVSMVVFAASSWVESLVVVVVGLVLSGLAMGLGAPVYVTAVANAVDSSDFGVAGGMSTTVMNIGSLTGIQAMFVVLGDSRSPGAFAVVYLFGAAVAAIGVLGGLMMSTSDPRAGWGSRRTAAPAAVASTS